MCRSWKLWAVVGAVVVAVVILLPGASGAVVPLLVIAACPLMMLLMGVGMFRGSRMIARADADHADRDHEVV